jgi:DNA-binding GntR family transcriptional regulator
MSFLELTPVEQRTLSDEAADRLRAAIRNGTLKPGMRLIERDLAERLGMSRIPIREAIQSLVEEGLAQKAPHRGAVVYIPTREEIEEISSLRVVLERMKPNCARLSRLCGRLPAARICKKSMPRIINFIFCCGRSPSIA